MASHGIRLDSSAPWRLSRIEEELERIESAEDLTSEDFPPPPPMAFSLPGSREGTLSRVLAHPPPPLPNFDCQGDEGIYSKAVINPDKDRAYEDLMAAKEALRYITEKYDSLGRVKAGGASGDKRESCNIGPSPAGYTPPPTGYTEGYDSLGRKADKQKQQSASLDQQDGGSRTRRSPSPAGQSRYGTYPGPRSRSQDSGHDGRHHPTADRFYPGETPRTPVDVGRPCTPVDTPRTPRTPCTPNQEHRFTYDTGHNARDQDRRSREPAKKIPMRTPSPLPPPPTEEGIQRVPPLPAPSQAQVTNPYNLDSTALSEQDILQVEMFYRSHKTEVFVCQCMVHLYIGRAHGGHTGTSGRSLPPPPPPPPGATHRPSSKEYSPEWSFVKSGVAVVVLDSGESRRQRKLHLVMAERGTGFVLWRDTLNHLSHYTAPQPSFHTFHFSTDHTRLAGLAFQDISAASQFLTRIRTITSDPGDSLLQLSGSGKSKKKDKKVSKKPKHKTATKADISSPCCFTHVTKLDRTDGMTMLTPPPKAPRLSSTASLPKQAKVKGSPQVPRS